MSGISDQPHVIPAQRLCHNVVAGLCPGHTVDFKGGHREPPLHKTYCDTAWQAGIHTIIIILLLFAFSFPAKADEAYKEIKVKSNNKVIATFHAQVADTQKSRAKGLMFRKGLKENEGMWFVFENDTTFPFWMENTYISLDIIFVSNKGKVISIARNTTPLSRKPIYSPKPYRYVLEIPAGGAAKIGLKTGDTIN